MIIEENIERAVDFLRDTAKEYGQLKGHSVYCEKNLSRVKALEMLNISEGSMASREAQAYGSESYRAAIVELQNATAEYETLRAQRDAAAIKIDVWRSQASAKSKGIDL